MGKEVKISENRDSSATSSYNHHPGDRRPHSPPEGSTARSSVSSLSHGFSPEREEEQAPPQHGIGSPQLDPIHNLPANPPSPVPVLNRYVVEEPVAVKKTDHGATDGFVRREPEGVVGGGGRRPPAAARVVKRMERVAVANKAALGFRLFEVCFCLISLSVMAADKNQGWALDSFYRYKEFRYCMSVNVIGFVYSVLQGCDLSYRLVTGNYYTRRHLFRYYLDFSLDQMVTYLLLSASSSAATRVDDWQSNWGKDKFPDMATASVGLSFVAFAAFAFSSIISGGDSYMSITFIYASNPFPLFCATVICEICILSNIEEFQDFLGCNMVPRAL